MLITNQTPQDYWFGPLHLLGGVGQTLTVDDTTETSLYLTEDSVADAINNLYLSGKITVGSAAAPFPRPTGVPQLLHGDGAPEGLVYAPQGSMYMRRDGTGADSLYTKTTGVTINTGWENYTTAAVGPGTTYRKTTVKDVVNTVTETDLLNSEITIPASEMGTSGMLRLTAFGDWKQNSGSVEAGPRFKLKLGPTTIFDTNTCLSAQVQNSASRLGWQIDATILNTGTGAQVCSIRAMVCAIGPAASGFSTVAFTTGEGAFGTAGSSTSGQMYSFYGGAYNTATVDTTVAQALVLSVILPVANANVDLQLTGALVEII